MTAKLITPRARLSFPNLFVARAMEDGQAERFSCALLFDEIAQKSAEFRALQQAALDAAKKRFGGDKAVAMIKNGQLRMPFRKGEEKEDYEGYGAGIVFINASTKRQPGVVGRDPRVSLTEDEIYAGCYVRASLNAFAYEVKGNRGVSFGLNNVQFMAPGESIGGRAPADQDFEPLDDDTGSTVDGDVDSVFA